MDSTERLEQLAEHLGTLAQALQDMTGLARRLAEENDGLKAERDLLLDRLTALGEPVDPVSVQAAKDDRAAFQGRIDALGALLKAVGIDVDQIPDWAKVETLVEALQRGDEAPVVHVWDPATGQEHEVVIPLAVRCAKKPVCEALADERDRLTDALDLLRAQYRVRRKGVGTLLGVLVRAVKDLDRSGSTYKEILAQVEYAVGRWGEEDRGVGLDEAVIEGLEKALGAKT